MEIGTFSKKVRGVDMKDEVREGSRLTNQDGYSYEGYSYPGGTLASPPPWVLGAIAAPIPTSPLLNVLSLHLNYYFDKRAPLVQGY